MVRYFFTALKFLFWPLPTLDETQLEQVGTNLRISFAETWQGHILDKLEVEKRINEKLKGFRSTVGSVFAIISFLGTGKCLF